MWRADDGNWTKLAFTIAYVTKPVDQVRQMLFIEEEN